jgi:hypothetical protein
VSRRTCVDAQVGLFVRAQRHVGCQYRRYATAYAETIDQYGCVRLTVMGSTGLDEVKSYTNENLTQS